jgi:hypothetical protein
MSTVAILDWAEAEQTTAIKMEATMSKRNFFMGKNEIINGGKVYPEFKGKGNKMVRG